MKLSKHTSFDFLLRTVLCIKHPFSTKCIDFCYESSLCCYYRHCATLQIKIVDPHTMLRCISFTLYHHRILRNIASLLKNQQRVLFLVTLCSGDVNNQPMYRFPLGLLNYFHFAANEIKISEIVGTDTKLSTESIKSCCSFILSTFQLTLNLPTHSLSLFLLESESS